MRQRGKSAWELRVYVGRDPLTHHKRWTSRTFHGGKREAQRALAAMVTELDGQVVAPKQATVGQLLDRWFEAAEPDFSPSTAREVRGFLDRNLIPALGATPLARLRTEDIDTYYRELHSRGAKNGDPLAPATIRRIHGILRRGLSQAVRWGWVRDNAAANAQLPRVPATDISPPQPADVVRLFTLAKEDDPDLATFVLLAAASGARRGELLALRWSRIDLDAGTLAIERGIVLGRQGLVEKDTKTHSARRIALDDTTIEGLRKHYERAVANARSCDCVLTADAFVFTHDPDGATPWRPDSTTRAFVRLRNKAGLNGVRLHDLRHYVATRLLTSGVDVRTVAGRLGHRSAATTLNVYAHFVAKSDQDAADVLGHLFETAATTKEPDSPTAELQAPVVSAP